VDELSKVCASGTAKARRSESSSTDSGFAAGF
jgi:hypothetical protein